MELTPTEKTLARGLTAFGATENMVGVILMLLNERESLQKRLISYMVEHQKATPRELLEQTIEMTR